MHHVLQDSSFLPLVDIKLEYIIISPFLWRTCCPARQIYKHLPKKDFRLTRAAYQEQLTIIRYVFSLTQVFLNRQVLLDLFCSRDQNANANCISPIFELDL